MEKYRQFSDPSTGANPFVPGTVVLVPRWLTYLFCFLVFPIVFLKASSLLVLCVLLYFQRILGSFVVSMISQLILFILGIWVRFHESIPSFSNDSIIISNYQSFFDILLSRVYAKPTYFAFATAQGTFYVTSSILSALKVSLASSPLELPGLTVGEVFNLNSRTVLFPEGWRTNGTGLLQFHKEISNGLKKAYKDKQVFVMAINYSQKSSSSWVTPQHCVGSGVEHITRILCYQFMCIVDITISECKTGTDARKELLRLYNRLRDEPAVLTEIDVIKAKEFLAYWTQTHNSSYFDKKVEKTI